ncbi:MAG: cyclopropane fatty acyl phospholipid synthase [Candidatus Paceibacterota bacterium]|jgi:cyclopropane-fatty-acyl-phospholipid synthase
MISKEIIENILKPADIKINGERSFDIKVYDDRFYSRILVGGALALGESYMDGWWDCEQLDECVSRIIRAKSQNKISFNLPNILQYLTALLTNPGTHRKAFEVGKKHYDLGNDLFEAMLDKRMVYTCAYWKNASNLDEAQEHKLDLVCKKLNLHEGQRILDIGCGWGSFMKFATEKYRVSVVGITVSKEQLTLVKESCVGLPIEIRLQDYRDLNEKFDHIVSLGMFEHVGVKNYSVYMNIAKKCLNDGGLFLLHTIGKDVTTLGVNPWIEKYIFPNGKIPSFLEISRAVENVFVVEDWHNFGADYDKTLCAWFLNFNNHWDKLSKKYGERFYKMWKFYLLSCAGAFRARDIELWQIVLSPNGVKGGYKSVR